MEIIRDQLNQSVWDAFVLKHGPRSGRFLQSWGWGDFQKSVGESVERVAWMSNEEPVAVAQVIRKKIPGFGTYAYIPRGPIEISTESDLIADAANVAHGDLFVRVESLRLQVTDVKTSKRSSVYTCGVREIQPSHTFITDLSQTEEQLFAHMHEKTRYNIRLAEKKGIEIEIGVDNFDDVWPVFEMTASRDEFRLHGKEYYRKMLTSKNAFLAIVKHDGEILAANIMIDFGDTRTYLHGASSNIKRNFMAPFLLHWELMKEAKKQRIQFYDWWGVAPVDASPTHTWTGISRFKRGFGGKEVSYFGATDVVLKYWPYTVYKLAQKIKRRFR